MSDKKNEESLRLINPVGNFSTYNPLVSTMGHNSQGSTPIIFDHIGSGSNRPSFVSPFSSIYHTLVNSSREVTPNEVKRELACKILKTNKAPEPFPCPVCGKNFSSKGNLKTHTYVHFTIKPYYCEDCGKGFTQKASLEAHKDIHLGKKPFRCDVCGKAFTQKGNFKTHMNSHIGQRPYACEICGRAFTQKGNMQTHAKTHYSEKPFLCPICGKSFTLKGNMKTHMLSHNGTKPFNCDSCEKSFTQKLSLEYHRNSHTGEKPYPCEICGKCFSQKGNMKTHMQSHLGAKSHMCPVCGKGFTQRGNMKTHMKLHLRVPAEEKPFSCHICAHSFVLRSSLECHLANHEKYMNVSAYDSNEAAALLTNLSHMNSANSTDVTTNQHEKLFSGSNVSNIPMHLVNTNAVPLGRPPNNPVGRPPNPLGRPPNPLYRPALGRPPKNPVGRPPNPHLIPLGRPPKHLSQSHIHMLANDVLASHTNTTSSQTNISMVHVEDETKNVLEARPILTHLRNMPSTNLSSLFLLASASQSSDPNVMESQHNIRRSESEAEDETCK